MVVTTCASFEHSSFSVANLPETKRDCYLMNSSGTSITVSCIQLITVKVELSIIKWNLIPMRLNSL